MGNMAFSGGVETLVAGKDPEGWMNVSDGRKVQETRHKSGELCNDILSIIQQENEAEGGVELTQLQAHADASFIIFAGSDTVSEAMTALIRYICTGPEVQSQLREDLLAPCEGAEGTSEDVFEFSNDRRTYLYACIQEVVPPIAAGP
ncbi:hypothetical protein H2248_012536 [Termitomyces sp. 'cryptogamus']|nr:hypothetical protein H2248_012536 [Termitomyces sp. 'cryptogamus']